MNLLPPGVSPGRWTVGRPGPSRRTLLLFGALFAGLCLAPIPVEVRSLTARLGAARSERERLAHRASERQRAEEQLRSDRERLAQLRAVEGRLARWQEERSLVPALLRGLSRAVPDTVVLETVQREGPDLQITGKGSSSAAVAAATAAFSGLEQIGSLELLWVEQVGGGSVTEEQRFSVAGEVRYASPDPPPFETVGIAEPDRGCGG